MDRVRRHPIGRQQLRARPRSGRRPYLVVASRSGYFLSAVGYAVVAEEGNDDGNVELLWDWSVPVADPIPLDSLYKSELSRNKGPWAGVTDLEIATAEYLDWFNHRRLHGEIGHIPPAEYETNHYAANPASSTELATTGSLH